MLVRYVVKELTERGQFLGKKSWREWKPMFNLYTKTHISGANLTKSRSVESTNVGTRNLHLECHPIPVKNLEVTVKIVYIFTVSRVVTDVAEVQYRNVYVFYRI
jgi:hypothetical protein